MSPSSVSLRPLVSWPEEVETGRKYLVTVDIEIADPESGAWPYDTEEYAVGCMLEGEPGLAVESVGDSTLVLHRFGGTYGPARFVTYAVDAAAVSDTALRLTLITAGGVPFRSERLRVRVGAGEEVPAPLPEVEVPLPTVAAEPAAPVAVTEDEGDEGEAVGTVPIVAGTAAQFWAFRRRLTGEVRRVGRGAYQAEIGRLSGTRWQVALLRKTTIGWRHSAGYMAEICREHRVPVMVSVVQGRGAPHRTDHGDLVVANRVVLHAGRSEPSRRLESVAREILGNSAHYDTVSSYQSGGAAVVSGEDVDLLQAVYTVPGIEHLTVCAVGEAAVDRAVEAVVAVLGALEPAVDPLALPSAPERLVGRDEELERLVGLLDPAAGERAQPHVTVVSGMPGIGKTALALAAAHAATERGWYPGGAYFIPAGTDAHAAVERVRSRLPDRHGHVLVVHDGMEPDDASPWIAPMSDRFHVLITARRRSVARPATGRLALGPLHPADALELLDPDGSDREAAGRLAELCGRVPLALRLAARSDLPLSYLLGTVEREGGIFCVLDALRDTYDAEYRRLTAEEQQALQLLALVPGPDAGPELLKAFGLVRLTETLDALGDTYLVEPVGTTPRRQLPPLVRAYLHQIPGRDGAFREWREQARQLLLDFCANRTREAVQGLGLGGWEEYSEPSGLPTTAVRWLDGERETLSALALGVAGDPNGRTATDLLLYFGAYLNWRRDFDVCLHLCGTALARETRQRQTAHLWRLSGIAERGLVRLDRAADSCLRAQALYLELNDVWGQAKAHDDLGLVYAAMDDWERAREQHTIACDEMLRHSDRRAQAEAVMHLGDAHLRLGDREEGLRCLVRAADLFQSRGDMLGVARAALSRAEALSRTGNAESAAGMAEEIVRDFAELGDLYGVARAWQVRARAAEHLGWLTDAETSWRKAESAFAGTGESEAAELAQERARLAGRRATEPEGRIRLVVEALRFRSASFRWTLLAVVATGERTVRVQGTGSGTGSGPESLGRSVTEQLWTVSESTGFPFASAPLEVCLPLRQFDVAPHLWAAGPAGEVSIGEQRPVTIRQTGRDRSDPRWIRRWNELRVSGRFTASHVLLTRKGTPPHIPPDVIPFVCGPVSTGPGRAIMSRLLDRGHGVVLWSTESHPARCGPRCEELYRQVRALVSGVGMLDELPDELWHLRTRDPGSPFSLLFDAPEAPEVPFDHR
ncbi:AAA family ATPase [Streptomyces sp. NPDC054794]